MADTVLQELSNKQILDVELDMGGAMCNFMSSNGYHNIDLSKKEMEQLSKEIYELSQLMIN